MAAQAPTESEALTALAHDLRVEIMRQVSRADAESGVSPVELAARLRMPLSNVAYHVRELRKRRAVTLVRTAQVRGSVQHFYVANERFVSRSWVAALLRPEALPAAP